MYTKTKDTIFNSKAKLNNMLDTRDILYNKDKLDTNTKDKKIKLDNMLSKMWKMYNMLLNKMDNIGDKIHNKMHKMLDKMGNLNLSSCRQIKHILSNRLVLFEKSYRNKALKNKGIMSATYKSKKHALTSTFHFSKQYHCIVSVNTSK